MKSRKKPISYYIGTSLIFVSLCGLTYIFYPVVQLYYFPTTQSVDTSSSFSLDIPVINASGRVIEQVDPFNKTEYTTALKQGIAHAKHTQLPGSGGMIFLFAHSSGLPWELTRNNTVFFRLGEVKKSDLITVLYNAKRYEYVVTEVKEVYPTEVNYLLKQDYEKETLILQTCTPIGTDWKRLLVFAQLVKSS
jgi:LPXTG-site transpeptidase (sortase) family protein